MAEETPMQRIAREAAEAAAGDKPIEVVVPQQEVLQAASESGC